MLWCMFLNLFSESQKPYSVCLSFSYDAFYWLTIYCAKCNPLSFDLSNSFILIPYPIHLGKRGFADDRTDQHE